ncbi:MAG: hypothetical protein ACRDY7_04125 [Acidimicrobiia bacterium]
MARNRPRLDAWTADRLAGGAVEPADAPPGCQHVADLLARAATVPMGEDSAADNAAVRAMAAAVRDERAAHSPTNRRNPVLSKIALVKALAALSVAGVASGAAASGDLPAPVQDVAATVAGIIDVDIPDPDEAADDADKAENDADKDDAGAQREADKAERDEARADRKADQDDAKAEQKAEKDEAKADRKADEDDEGDEGEGPGKTQGHNGIGPEISDFARTTELTGAEKGAAVSSKAHELNRGGEKKGAPEETPADEIPDVDAEDSEDAEGSDEADHADESDGGKGRGRDASEDQGGNGKGAEHRNERATENGS